jgi:hypothetical protein
MNASNLGAGTSKKEKNVSGLQKKLGGRPSYLSEIGRRNTVQGTRAGLPRPYHHKRI